MREDIQAAVSAICESSGFKRSPRLQRFLRYVVERASSGDQDAIKEYSVAVAVYDKDPSFDPQLDPIVRVEAGRLRSRLLEYYSGPGRGQPVVIELPKGTYLPTIRFDGVPAFAPARGSIAVMPICAGSDSELLYLVEGLCEALTIRFARTRQIKVVPWSVVRAMAHNHDDPSLSANLLKAETLLAIRGTAHADSCDLYAEWFDSAAHSPLWARHYQGNREEITAVEEDIFAEVVHRLIPNVSQEHLVNPRKFHTTLPHAYQQYLKGRYLWNRRTPDALIKAIRHYREALDADPLFALAYAGMADAYLTLGTFLFLSPQHSLPRAKHAAAKALEIDETLGEALTTLACTRAVYEWEWVDASCKFEAATALEPAYAVGRQWYGFCLCATGKFDAGLKQLNEALELDPLSSMIETQIAAAFYLQRRYNEAIQICEKVLQTDPHFWAALLFLGQCHDCMNQYSQAVSELKAASDYSGGAPLAVASLGHALGRMGAVGEAECVLSGLLSKTPREYVPRYCLSLISCGLARYDDAMKYLEEAQVERSPAIALWIRGEPRLDPLRKRPRFHQLLQSMHLD